MHSQIWLIVATFPISSVALVVCDEAFFCQLIKFRPASQDTIHEGNLTIALTYIESIPSVSSGICLKCLRIEEHCRLLTNWRVWSSVVVPATEGNKLNLKTFAT